MSKFMGSRSWALALLAATALCAPAAAYADDRPADDAGAKTIADFLSAYVGKAALPSVKVTQQGTGYRAVFDLSQAMAGVKPAGVVYEPAEIAFNVVQQDDGQRRIEMAPVPPIVGHVTPPEGKGEKVDFRVETTGARQTLVIDPKLNWLSSSHGVVDKASVVERGAGLEEFFEFGDVKVESKTASAANGLTTTGTETVGSVNFVLDVDPKGIDPHTGGPRKPVHVSAQGADGAVAVALADFQPTPLLDAWKFSVAHPDKADVARDIDALKSVVTAVAADHMRLNETLQLDKLDVLTESGTIGLKGVGVEIGAANMGADSGFSERFSAHEIKLPDALAPPAFAALAPTSFEFGFKATGFDIEGGAQEWVADAKAGPDGVTLSEEDRAKVMKKFVGSRPVVVDIVASRFLGPSLDLGMSGKVTVEDKQPTGTITLTLKGFDRTAEALEHSDPQVASQLTPFLAMARGLGKPGPDGGLVWVCTLGPDHVIKVNGMPLGKSPF